jgi:hypothetical protein
MSTPSTSPPRPTGCSRRSLTPDSEVMGTLDAISALWRPTSDSPAIGALPRRPASGLVGPASILSDDPSQGPAPALAWMRHPRRTLGRLPLGTISSGLRRGPVAVSLCVEAVAQSGLPKPGLRSLEWPCRALGEPRPSRARCGWPMTFGLFDPTLRTDPVRALGVCATASVRSSSAVGSPGVAQPGRRAAKVARVGARAALAAPAARQRRLHQATARRANGEPAAGGDPPGTRPPRRGRGTSTDRAVGSDVSAPCASAVLSARASPKREPAAPSVFPASRSVRDMRRERPYVRGDVGDRLLVLGCREWPQGPEGSRARKQRLARESRGSLRGRSARAARRHVPWRAALRGDR